jgi:RNA polymerase sigma-70 factor (ECF subfamily)
VALLPDAWLAPPAPTLADGDVVPARPATVAASLSRDEAALAALYAEHAPGIQRFLGDLLGDRAAAADATQETFVRAFRRIDTLREVEKVAPWLFGIARNVSLEVRKARRRHGRVVAADGEDEAGADGAAGERTPEDELLGREAARVVEGALGRLSDDRRAMLLLRLDHGLAYEDIAKLMGFTVAKVKVEIHRARQVLRAELLKYEGGSS